MISGLTYKFKLLNRFAYFANVFFVFLLVIVYGQELINTTKFLICNFWLLWFFFEREIKHANQSLHGDFINGWHKDKILKSIKWSSKLPMLGCCSQMYFCKVYTKHDLTDFKTTEEYVIAHNKLFINFLQLIETGFLLLNVLTLLEFIVYFCFCFNLKKAFWNISFIRDKNDSTINFYNRPAYNWLQYLFDINNLKLV